MARTSISTTPAADSLAAYRDKRDFAKSRSRVGHVPKLLKRVVYNLIGRARAVQSLRDR